ncbi:MAG: ROK family protein [Luteitalea sp.]|nr:ROK family protein [Luteitalea sp.]
MTASRPVPACCHDLEGGLVVSCQATEEDFFSDPSLMAGFARAAVAGGAIGIRANGPADIHAIRQAVSVPIIGIQKVPQPSGKTVITPSLEAARPLVGAGADMIALDCTDDGQRNGALTALRRIKAELRVPVLADIATIEEALAAQEAGADFALSTLRGYTPETTQYQTFEPAFIAELVRALRVPVMAEGRIETPQQARQALDAGAFAVIVGSAITRPTEITRRFVAALRHGHQSRNAVWVGIDLGATNTKSALVGSDGTMSHSSSVPTPWNGGREPLLDHLASVADRCLKRAADEGWSAQAIGVATAGWVDSNAGQVVYATELLPGWTGTPIAAELERRLGLPVAAENDANAAAVAENRFGAARGSRDFVCISLGTGVGGGCYIGGRLSRGSHYLGNALGHVCLEPEGLPCSCGQHGCLEVYANAGAVVRYAGDPSLDTAEKVIDAARSGSPAAREALRVHARRLARGCASIIHVLDPQMLVFSGGLTENNPFLVADLEKELRPRVSVWSLRRLHLCLSRLGYAAGVLGAASVAMEPPGVA